MGCPGAGRPKEEQDKVRDTVGGRVGVTVSGQQPRAVMRRGQPRRLQENGLEAWRGPLTTFRKVRDTGGLRARSWGASLNNGQERGSQEQNHREETPGVREQRFWGLHGRERFKVLVAWQERPSGPGVGRLRGWGWWPRFLRCAAAGSPRGPRRCRPAPARRSAGAC